MEPAADTVRAHLRSDLREAMRARDRIAVDALRAGLSAIDQAEAVPLDDAVVTRSSDGPAPVAMVGDDHAEVARLNLDTAQVTAALQAEIDERRRAVQELQAAGQPDAAARAERELQVLLPHVPPA